MNIEKIHHIIRSSRQIYNYRLHTRTIVTK